MDKWFRKKYRVKVDNKMPYFGETDTTKKIIKVNVKKSKSTKNRGEVLDSISHEINHAKYPKKSEKSIEKITERQKLSKKQKSKFYKLIQK